MGRADSITSEGTPGRGTTLTQGRAARRQRRAKCDQNERDKALVMRAVRTLVHEGKATWRERPSGDIELRLSAGQTYLLGEREVTRIC